jgi:hypothetical protein
MNPKLEVPKLQLLEAADFHPSPAADLAALQGLLAQNWEEELAAITGPVGVSLIGTQGVAFMLSTGSGWPNFNRITLHSENPGTGGAHQVLAGAGTKTVHWGALSGRKRSNSEAVEWAEITEKATVEYFALWVNEEFGAFCGYGSLTEKIVAEKGDTLRANIGALAIEVP